ncbi:resuscitation-promoting factor [Nakamurella leprariae]|uniref:DUF348 domain-containing protein n=1 Tax=Nakamurella leprariae TaxID=2803911 RepID=A0A938YFJ1_9ACTN|nr:resuscitation-promoting factor [Nakamurella leprariae]MBM9468643.1 DUF348 domain-containing protein [Nakamurella leprariae]
MNHRSTPAEAAAAVTEPAPPTRRRIAGWPPGRRVLLVGASVTLVVAAIGGGTAAALSKTVTVTVDGQAREVTTLAGSVDGALASAGLSVGEHDVLAPAPGSSIADGAQIVLDRGRLFTVTVDGRDQQIWTTATTVEEALAELGTGLDDASEWTVSADRSRDIPLDGLSLVASPRHAVSLTDGAAAGTEVDTDAATVADLLTEQGIVLGARDTVEPAGDTPLTDDLSVVVIRTDVRTVTEQVPVAQPADEHRPDDTLATGTSVVVEPGAAGVDEVTVEITTVNGVETGRVEVARTPVTPAKASVVHDGTKSSLEWRGSRVFFHDTEFGVNWDGLAYCESTNNPKATYYPSGYPATFGLFQFDLPTWQSVQGSGNPMDASPEEQLMRAKLLYQKRGLEPWLCGYAASSPPPA